MNSKWNRWLGILICLLVGSFALTSTTTAHGAETKASVTKQITVLEKQITKLQKKNGSAKTIQAKQKKLKTYRDALKDKVVFSTKRIDLYEEEIYKVKYSFQKQTASINSVKWSVDNKQVATVSAKGVVTGRKEGTCYLTATAATMESLKIWMRNMMHPTISARKIRPWTITTVAG